MPGAERRTAPVSAVTDALGRRPLLLVGFGTLLFSTGPVMVAGATVSGPVLSFWRLWIGAGLMGALTLVHVGVSGRRPDRTGWTWSAGCGLAFGAHQLCFMSAIQATSVVDVTLMGVLAPIFVGVLAAIVFGERPGLRFRLWSLVAIAGAVVVVLAGAVGPEGDPVGMALAVANVAFFAVYFVGSKQARGHIDTVPFLFGTVVAAGVLVSAYVGATGEPVGSIGRADLAIAAAIAVVPGFVGHFVSTWPLDRVAANVPPVMQLAIPFLSGSLAWWLLGQPITALHLVGGVITIAGVAGTLLSPAGRRLARPGPDATLVPGD